jgi:inorganic pyrophosphatase
MRINAIIEMPAGSIHKYEVDKKTGGLVLDRPLNQPIPHNYGYISDTLCEDGDPLDVFVLTDTSIYPLTKVRIEILSVLKCLDNGQRDDKIIATLVGDCNGYEHMGIASIQNYLETYKTGFQIIGFGDKEEAIKVYNESMLYKL